MNAPVMDTKNPTESAHPHFVRFMEGIEMNLSRLAAKLNNQVSAILNSNAPAKILGGIALGGLLMAAVALPSSPAHADDPARPLVETRLVIPDSFWESFYEQMAADEGWYTGVNSSSPEVTPNTDGFWGPFYERMIEVERDGAHSPLAKDGILDADRFWGLFYERMIEVEHDGAPGLAAADNGPKHVAFWVPFYERMSEIERLSGAVNTPELEAGKDSERFWESFYERMAELEGGHGLERN